MRKEKAIAEVLRYHEQTKHHAGRFARGPGHMDWANEPDPFRSYEEATMVRLPLLQSDPAAGHLSLYTRSENSPLPFCLAHIGAMLELSLGLSAWKSYGGSRWALRMNPSSGNLHPTEAHLILPPMDTDMREGGLFHYNPYVHGLEQRSAFDKEFWGNVRSHFGTDILLIGLSSIHWRESWKYGERALRYCNLDVGHAVACISFAANVQGWKARYLNTIADKEIETLLGFDRTAWHEQEREWPDLLLLVHAGKARPASLDLTAEMVASFSSLTIGGMPNRLSREHADWSIIRECALASEKARSPELSYSAFNHAYLEQAPSLPPAAKIIRQRRSAQAFDGKTTTDRGIFFAMIDKTIPRQDCAPFDAVLGEPSVHLAVFVHRVTGLAQGLYLLIRDDRDLKELKQKCNKDFLWQKVEGPVMLGLYLLKEGDYREIAATVSCYQDIAGDSAFSLGMIARFRENIGKDPWRYRRLFWEAGMIGQVLYLEAEAHGLRGTGIGCFLDDMMHGLLGISDDSYQDIYHFTVGMPVEDRRVSTVPPYHHLKA